MGAGTKTLLSRVQFGDVFDGLAAVLEDPDYLGGGDAAAIGIRREETGRRARGCRDDGECIAIRIGHGDPDRTERNVGRNQQVDLVRGREVQRGLMIHAGLVGDLDGSTGERQGQRHRGGGSRTGCEIGAEDGHDLIGRGVVSGVTGRIGHGDVGHVGRLAVHVVRRTRIDGRNRARAGGRLGQRGRGGAADHLGSAQYEVVDGVDELHGPTGNSAAGQRYTQICGNGHLRGTGYVGQRGQGDRGLRLGNRLRHVRYSWQGPS